MREIQPPPLSIYLILFSIVLLSLHFSLYFSLSLYIRCSFCFLLNFQCGKNGFAGERVSLLTVNIRKGFCDTPGGRAFRKDSAERKAGNRAE